MIIWLDTQLSPVMASRIGSEFSVQAIAARDLGLRDAKDQEIFLAARKANALVMTKDTDFVHIYNFDKRISTRRFFARLASVSLGAMGRSGP